jgi:hypothetical protein
MHSFLTGKPISNEHPAPGTNTLVEESWTSEAHLAAMRRLLELAGKPMGDQSASHLISAARVHVEAAKTAGRAPLPVKTAPAWTMSRDGDAPMAPQPQFCEYGDRVRRLYRPDTSDPNITAPPGAEGTVTDITRGTDTDGGDWIGVRWDNDSYQHGQCRRDELEILSRYDAAATPEAAARELAATAAKANR